MIFNIPLPKDEAGRDKYPYLAMYTHPLKRAERDIVGREAEKSSVLAAMHRPELCNVILLADAGSGKALADDTLIPVNDDRGYVRIGDIAVGDLVFDDKGLPVKVLGVFHQGMKHAYRVSFIDGTSVVCNDEHIWAARKYYEHHRDGESRYREVTLREMMDFGIRRSVNRGSDTVSVISWYIPVCKPVVRKERGYRVDPYAMGLLIGCGCFGDNSLLLSVKDEALAQYVGRKLGATAHSSSVYGNMWRFTDGNHIWGENSYISVADFIRISGCGCITGLESDVSIPREYFLGSVDQRFELLRGLMDSRGSISSDDRANCSYVTSSPALADDVRELAASLGIRVYVTERYKDMDVEYSLHLSVESERKADLFKRGKRRDIALKHIAKHRGDRGSCKSYRDMSLTDVEDLGVDVPMTCIYVDSPDHLYLAGKEHIVTHNTALVQGLMVDDMERYYIEVDLAKMIADIPDVNQMAEKLKTLFDEVQRFSAEENIELVLFIDEFHQIVQLSAAAVEALKPLLADSGTRGIRVIAATTFVEFRKWIAPNQPLVERLQRINLSAPSKKMVVEILRNMAKRYGVDQQFYNDSLFEEIYELTERYVPANAQPRKSILVLDAMVGWYRYTHRRLDKKLLADVIYESEGVNVTFRVDAASIKQRLDERVFAQELASTVIQNRLQICVADLNNKSKPMSSFLFTGSTGVGKEVADDEIIPVYDETGVVAYKRNGDLEVGDYVFDREGNPTKVIGVFPQGVKDVYEVEFVDGRKLRVGDGHLWTYKSRFGNGSKHWRVADTVTLMDKYSNKYYNDGRSAHNIKFVIPMNQAVKYPKKQYETDPYVVGVAIGNGCLREKPFIVSSDDMFVIDKLAGILGAVDHYKNPSSYSYSFYTGRFIPGGRERYQTADVLRGDAAELIGKRSGEKFIPESYKYGSIEQRWSLIQGLFDTDGTVDGSSSRFNVHYSTSSERLAYDVQDVLYSLGISSSVNCHKRVGKSDEYDVYVKCDADVKPEFFSLPRKKSIAAKAIDAVADKVRVKKFREVLGIRDIRKLDEKASMTCIMVDNYEHLYQAGQYIVTHNTEMTKQLAKILFNDPKSFIRFDMTEYAEESSLTAFKHELTMRVWERPFSIILLDEIEKACGPVTRLLLQVLDDGRLMDENNREVPFVNSYIVMTTNAGNEIYKDIAQYAASDTGSGENLKKYEKLIRKSISETQGDNKFPPELLGRIDCIVPFQPLSEKTQMSIVGAKLHELRDTVMAKHGVNLRVHKDVIPYLVKDTLDTESNSGGARAVIARLESEVVAAVSKELLLHPEASELMITLSGTAAYQDKTKLESEARIVVSPYLGRGSRG